MNQTKIKALLVEDNPGDARLIREMLIESNGAGGIDMQHYSRLSEAIEYLGTNNTDVVLLDLSLPDSQGLDTLARLHTATMQSPVVILTGLNDEMLATQAVHEGAQDYLVKGQFDGDLLIHSIRYAIERHRLRIELEETRRQQLEMKDRFLSRVSHEFRTPLAAIHQFVTIMLDGLAGNLTPEQYDYLEITLNNVKQLRSMVDDLLEVTRAQTDRLKICPQSVPLTKLISETMEAIQIADGKDISLLKQLPDDLPPVYADPNRVRQIMVNLIDNAIQFTPDKGTITVRAEVFSDDTEYLCVSVADTGCGISAEEQELIFEYLYQVENDTDTIRRGLGLGLNICQELVSRQNGKIWVDSEIGQGSTFYFTLPIFSMQKFLSPILTEKNLQTGTLALITIEASHIEKSRSAKSDDIAVQEAWSIIQRLMPDDIALLLPIMPQPQSKMVFFIIAFTDQLDTGVLFPQIQGHLARCQSLNNAGFNPVISFTVLDLPLVDDTSPADGLIENVLKNTEARIEITADNKQG